MFKRFARDRKGATVVEYGLIVAVLSLAIVAGVGTATNALQFLFANNTSKLQQTLN
ncbi:MAG: Flp family type IVb pilin [Rhizobiaceae bacterium]|jgi:pilus assembly protein Flp/PilA|nr:Flp family type IVb pilin [Rhizobiaceae bacterium]MBO6724044.1 Flp family type IVb pilin [Rhizobiaceae bacterium]